MFTVTRQRQFPDGENVVEVSAGGLDYTNPDALGAKYAVSYTHLDVYKRQVSGWPQHTYLPSTTHAWRV